MNVTTDRHAIKRLRSVASRDYFAPIPSRRFHGFYAIPPDDTPRLRPDRDA